MLRRRNPRWRLFAGLIAAAAPLCIVGAGLWVVTGVDASAPGPISVTPYSGYSSELTRAPYLTDLAQSSVDVNWATTESAPGSITWGPMSDCSENTATVPSTLPDSVPNSDTTSTITSREFTVESETEYQSSVELSGLSPSTAYCYRIYSADSPPVDLLGSNPAPTFTTLDSANPASTTPVTFDVVGDLGEDDLSAGVPYPGNLNPDQAAIDQLIGESGARFVITSGDMGYPGGSEDNFGDLANTGNEVSDVFGPSYWPETGGIPTFYTDGDHGQNVTALRDWPETATATAASGVYADISYPSVDGTNAATYPNGWFAFSTGNVRIYDLDAAWAEQNLGTATGSACGPVGSSAADYCEQYQIDSDTHWTTSSPEYQWLENDLASHPGYVKLAFFHYPPRSDNATQPSDVYLQNSSSNPNYPNSLEALLVKNGVDIVFNGRAHTYQRIAPDHSIASTASPSEVVNYITGGGGGILEPILGGSTCSGLEATETIYALGWSPTSGTGSSCGAPKPATAADVYNFLKVTVAGDKVTVTPVNAAGGDFDSQTYTVNTGTSLATTSLTTSLSSSTVAEGGSVTDAVTLSGATSSASGAITVSLYTGTSASDCTGADLVTNETASPTTDGDGTYSATFNSTATAGEYELRASYAGDSKNSPSESSCGTEPLSVTAPATWSVTSYSAVESAAASSLTISVPPGTTAGDDLVVVVALRTGASESVSSITDSAGNTWAKEASAYTSGVTNRSEYWEATDALAIPTDGTVKLNLSSSEVAAAYLLAISGGASGAPACSVRESSSTTPSGDATSGDVTPFAGSDLQVGWVQTPSSATGIGTVTPEFTAGAGTQLSWLESSSGSTALWLDVSWETPGTTAPEAYSTTFSGTPAWSTGIATLEAS